MEINHHQNKNGLQNTKWLQKNKIIHMAIRNEHIWLKTSQNYMK